MDEYMRVGIPEVLDRLAQNDPLIYAFCSSLRATGRRWDSDAAIELITHMSQHSEQLTKQLVRLFSLTPMPPLVFPPTD